MGALGPGRLDNLEAIARANDTLPKKVAFSQAVWNVAKNMSHGAIAGGAVGGFVGGVAGAMGGDYREGAAVGAGVGAGLGAGGIGSMYIPGILKAVAANPRIGRSLTFAIEAGARPEAYGPMIARMVQADHESAERDPTAQAETATQ